MSHTIDLMERQFRKAVDWRTRVRQNPVPYVAGGAAVLYLLVGGPRRTADLIRRTRPRPKTKLEKLVDQLPEPIAERLAPPVKKAVDDLSDVPENLRKKVREVQKERDKQLQREEEERLRKAARATMAERLLTKAAEAAGTAAAAAAVKMVSDRLMKEKEAS
jgi:hypothetical protein